MERRIAGLTLIVLLLTVLAPKCFGQKSAAQVVKQQSSYTLSLELEFSKKNRNNLQRAMSLLLALGPNGHATGFLVGDGLVMTAYHVVSGELSDSKKIALGFSPKDQLQVKVFVNGCQATVLRVDKEADLALSGNMRFPQTSQDAGLPGNSHQGRASPLNSQTTW